jgi:uncharacterized alkaline shock family protein YloU
LEQQNLEGIEMDNEISSQGKTTVAPEVLLTIARLTTLHIDGVSRMGSLPASVNRLFQPGSGEGVSIEIKDDTVTIDLYVILKQDVSLRDVSRAIQHEVARAISEMVGMPVGRINIHVEDIDYAQDQPQEKPPEA